MPLKMTKIYILVTFKEILLNSIVITRPTVFNCPIFLAKNLKDNGLSIVKAG